MGISNEIKFATNTVDEMTLKRILEIKAMIAFSHKRELALTTKKSARKCAAYSEILFHLLNLLPNSFRQHYRGCSSSQD